MEEAAALALVQCAQDELLQVRDAPAKGAGAVGCFARLACVAHQCSSCFHQDEAGLL